MKYTHSHGIIVAMSNENKQKLINRLKSLGWRLSVMGAAVILRRKAKREEKGEGIEKSG